VHDGYPDSDSMILETVTILGLRDDVTQVFDHNTPIDSSQYNQDSVSKRVR